MKNTKDSIINLLITVAIFLSALFLLWLLISFLDVISHNMLNRAGEYGKFLDWNLFTAYLGWCGA
ncbi:MAG: hypothetical protein IJZ89_03340 [Clostridia bacterium]|nr:hypothetical protein [Clostridia bacterium]